MWETLQPATLRLRRRCMLEMPACLHRAPRCLKRDEVRDGERGSLLGDLRLGVSSIRDSICICVSCALVSSELSFLSSFVVPLVSLFLRTFSTTPPVRSLYSISTFIIGVQSRYMTSKPTEFLIQDLRHSLDFQYLYFFSGLKLCMRCLDILSG